MGMLENDLDDMLRAAREMNFDLIDLYRDHARWSQQQFGLDDERGPLGPIRHLKKEAVELEAAPNDPEEYADAFLLLLDASRRAGIGLGALIQAARDKLEINKAREWPKGSPDQPVEHLSSNDGD
jgi:hypothetical protein